LSDRPQLMNSSANLHLKSLAPLLKRGRFDIHALA
jgi:hypothetical protein